MKSPETLTFELIVLLELCLSDVELHYAVCPIKVHVGMHAEYETKLQINHSTFMLFQLINKPYQFLQQRAIAVHKLRFFQSGSTIAHITLSPSFIHS